MFSPSSHTDYRHRDVSSPVSGEPMTLGSPSPKIHPSQSFLPPYLFGEATPSPISKPSYKSPTATTPKPPFFTTPVSRFREQESSFHTPSLSTPVKPGGPPVQGLLYTPTTASSSQLEAAESPVVNRLTCDTSVLSPAQIDPFFTQGEALQNCDQLDESWVTVFGFPAASASYIVQQFSQYGNIVQQEVSSTGNWMHLRFQSKLQAKKALSKNGKIFSENIMVGVKPCIHMDVMKEKTVEEEGVVKEKKKEESEERPTLKNIRPLTQAYQTPPTTPAAKRSGSIVSRAFEYIWKLH